MFNHCEILDKIEEIEVFFKYVGLKKIQDLPKNWDLDSNIRFEPINSPFIIKFMNKDKILLHIDVSIVSGINFHMRGDVGVSVYETIKTDYNFQATYYEGSFFKEELRDFKIKDLI